MEHHATQHGAARDRGYAAKPSAMFKCAYRTRVYSYHKRRVSWPLGSGKLPNVIKSFVAFSFLLVKVSAPASMNDRATLYVVS